MRAENLTESLAILSLINQYNTASARFLGSNFFKVISRRNFSGRSTHSLARLITVELLKTDGVILPQVYQSINELARPGGRRTDNFRITAFPVEEAFVVGNLVEGNQTIAPPQLLRCEGLSTKIGIISDNFITRSDIPQLTRLSVLGAGVPNCDGTSYSVGQEAHGTNLAGVVASICPNCQLLGYDIGCAQKSKSVFSTNDLMRAIINAMLRDVAVVILPNAERNFDRLLSNIVNIAQDAAMVVVAPAGDKGFNAVYYPFFPAAFPGVFGVVAIGPDRQAAPFSNQGPWAISSALGVGITTAHTSNSFISMSSTAIAAARFAGLVGRYFAANQKASSSSLARAQNTQQFQQPSQDVCLKVAAGGPKVPDDELGEDGFSSQTPLCPSGANDLDKDGTLDCLDGCHTDPLKTSPGQCGCGIPDVDNNSNGIVDCRERFR